MNPHAMHRHILELLRDPVRAAPGLSTSFNTSMTTGAPCSDGVLTQASILKTVDSIKSTMAEFDRGRAASYQGLKRAIEESSILMPPSSHLKEDLDFFKRGAVFGTAVRESKLALTTAPAKVHKHRRGQTKAYHARIQKKWTKRFGTKQVPGAYMIDTHAVSLFGRGEKVLVAHPEILKELKGVL